MTIEIKDAFTIKSKRTEHPNAGKYPGRPSMEFGTALRHFLSDIGISNLDAFGRGEYVFDESVTAEFFDSLQPDDIVGLGLLKGFNEYGENEHKSPCAYKFKIVSIDKNTDTIQARNVTYEQMINKSRRKNSPESDYKGTEVELTFEDVSCAFGMGFGEILERDGKPYGVSEEIELKVKVFGDKKDDNEVTNTSGPTNALLPENTETKIGDELTTPIGDSKAITEDQSTVVGKQSKAKSTKAKKQ